MTPSDNPLTDEELDELDRFLLETEGLEEAMDVSMLDGYFAALLSGPTTIMPSEWMRWVWDTEEGEGSPVFESTEQAQYVMSLMMRHMNDVTTILLTQPECYEPLLMQSPGNGDPVPVIDEWCLGFMKGVSLDAERWAPLMAGHPDWVSTIVLYGTEEGWDVLERKKLSLDAHRELAEGLGAAVRKVHAFFLEGRNARAAAGESGFKRREPVRNTAKVGRNDPCPCGSGKKYKLCHGSGPQSLH